MTLTLPVTGILTARGDNSRLGVNDSETTLTTANVNTTTFGKLTTLPVDGRVYAQPLVVGNQFGGRPIVYVATMHGSIYAFDGTTVIWQRSLLEIGGAALVKGTDYTCPYMPSEVSILSTPVIDPATGTLYAVAMQKLAGNFVATIRSLNILTGADVKPAVTISATGFVTSPVLTQIQRSALTLDGTTLYLAWGSACDTTPYHGWVMAYDTTDMSQTYAWSSTPSGSEGGIWNPGLMVADGTSVYVNTGNGDWNGTTQFSTSVVKLDAAGAVSDWFTPFNQAALSAVDCDISSSSMVLLGDGNLVTGSKGLGSNCETLDDGVGTIYVLDSTNLGHQVNNDTQIVQKWNHGVSIYSPLAFFNDTLYVADKTGGVTSYTYSGGSFTTTPAHTNAVGNVGRSPVYVSANGVSEGIVWVSKNNGANATLFALKASDLTTLWTSDQAAANRDQAAAPASWASPVPFNGLVYLGGVNAVTVYGLLP